MTSPQTLFWVYLIVNIVEVKNNKITQRKLKLRIGRNPPALSDVICGVNKNPVCNSVIYKQPPKLQTESETCQAILNLILN